MPVEAPLTEIRVSYSVGFKKNMGNYQSADVHVSESETYDVSGLDTDTARTLSDERYEVLKERVDERLSFSLEELSG
jgi:hypothetical protein